MTFSASSFGLERRRWTRRGPRPDPVRAAPSPSWDGVAPRRRGARRTARGWHWPRQTGRGRDRRRRRRAGPAPGPGRGGRGPLARGRTSVRSGCTGTCPRQRSAPGPPGRPLRARPARCPRGSPPSGQGWVGAGRLQRRHGTGSSQIPNQTSGIPWACGRVHRQLRIQSRGLVGDVAERPPPGVRGPLDLGQHADELTRVFGHQDPVGSGTPERRPGAEVVEAGPGHRGTVA